MLEAAEVVIIYIVLFEAVIIYIVLFV